MGSADDEADGPGEPGFRGQVVHGTSRHTCCDPDDVLDRPGRLERHGVAQPVVDALGDEHARLGDRALDAERQVHGVAPEVVQHARPADESARHLAGVDPGPQPQRRAMGGVVALDDAVHLTREVDARAARCRPGA